MSLKNLIEKRKNWVQSSQENDFDIDSIIAGLYNDPSHFVYEILQNAEDAAAKAIRFELFEDRLDIYHNGRDFDYDDIDRVTAYGNSKKQGDITAIGKFGVGFKSVFAITETPYIFSGEYRIMIAEDELGPDFETLLQHKRAVEQKLSQHSTQPPFWSKYAWVANYHNFFCDQFISITDDYKIDMSVYHITPSLII